MDFKIATLNIKGLRDKSKVSLLSVFLLNHFVDILFLQETHLLDKKEGLNIADTLGFEGFWSHGGFHSRGVGLLINRKSDFSVSTFANDEDGRIIAVNGVKDNVKFRFINIYAPNNGQERREFFCGLERFLSGNRNIVLGGDFNFVENVFLDKIGGDAAAGSAGSSEFLDLKRNFLLEDALRQKYPLKWEFTFSGQNVFTRLDRFYVNFDFISFVRSVAVLPCSFSDHDLVLMGVDGFSDKLTGPGYWKCNTSVFVGDFRNLWEDLSREPHKDFIWWEDCKEAFKSLIIFHSKRLSRERRCEITKLEHDLAFFRSLEASDPGTYADEVHCLRDQLNAVYNSNLEGAKIRSKVSQLEGDEKPTKFYLRKEVSHAKVYFGFTGQR